MFKSFHAIFFPFHEKKKLFDEVLGSSLNSRASFAKKNTIMKKRYSTLIACILGVTSVFAQSWQTVGSGFLNFGDIATNLQVLSYQDTAFVAYADMDVVKLKKRSGNNWATVINQSTDNNYFKFIYGTDNKPYLITLSRAASVVSVGSTGFFADIHEYDNGALTLVESREMLFVPSGTNMLLDVTNFDFTIRPNGDMAGIIRYPSAARSVYNVKIGNNPWFSETVYYEAIGGTSGNAIERSKLTFFDEGVIIASKWIGGSAGVLHLFRHDNNSSTPISSAFDNANAGLSFTVGAGVDPLKITAKNDTVFLSHRNGANERIFRSIYYDQNTIPVIGTTVLQTYPSNTFGLVPVFTASNNYMIYIEENQSTFQLSGNIVDLPADYSLTNPQLLGGTQFSLGEQAIGPEAMSVDPSNGEVYVAYIHGPPMTQSIVRKFGCGAVTAAYDENENELSITSNYSASASFEWVKCGETTVLSTDDTFEPTEDGDYQVTVTDGNCEATSNCVTVEIEEEDTSDLSKEEKNSLKLFPNPSSGNVQVEGENLIGAQLNVLDFTGKIVHTETLITNTTAVELSSLSKGVYVFSIVSANKSFNQKVIIN
jgi:hypothetical protein